MIALTDTATGIIAAAVVVIVALILNRKLSVKFRNVEAKLGSIDRAVNQRSSVEPTLSDDVKWMRARIAGLERMHAENVRRLSAIERTLKEKR